MRSPVRGSMPMSLMMLNVDFSGIGAGAPFDITSDQAVLGVNGDSVLTGNVQVLQGDRELHANHAHYDPTTRSFDLQGGVEYNDSLVHVTGRDGDYTQDKGANFTAAEFELHQRPARGSADVLHLTPRSFDLSPGRNAGLTSLQRSIRCRYVREIFPHARKDVRLQSALRFDQEIHAPTKA